MYSGLYFFTKYISMKITLQFIFTISIGLLLQFGANAQELTKTKVAFHEDIYVITKSIENKINYFSDKYPSFHTAELYRLTETSYQLEIEQRKEGEAMIKTRNLSKSEFETLRAEISNKILEEDIVLVSDQSGRFLKVQSIALQGFLGGTAIGQLIGDRTHSYGVAESMPYIGIGGGILGGVLGTAKRDVHLAPTLGYASGAFMGGLHGLLVGTILSDDNSFDNGSIVLLSSAAFSVGESLLLQHIVRKNNMNAKRASALRLGNLSGGISGMGLSLLLGGEDVNEYLFTGLTLGGSTAGMILYDRYFRNKNIGVGNMQAIRIMNPIFTIGSSAVISDLFDLESPASVGAMVLGSSIAGVFLGEAMFKSGNVSYSESLWYGVGAYGGAILGTGISILVLSGTLRYSNATAAVAGILTASSLGGMYLVHSVVSNNYDEEGIGFLENNNIRLNANPASLYVNKFINNPAYQQSAISLNWTF